MHNADTMWGDKTVAGRTARWLRIGLCLHFAFCILHYSDSVLAQRLLDRIVARVDGYPITLTDTKAAVALGIVSASQGPDERGIVELLVDRQLMLAEVDRFPPPEPSSDDIAREETAMTARAGGRLAEVMDATGLDGGRIRDMARDSLRIQAYLNQRFGTATQLSADEVLDYYRIHPDEFTRDGRLMPFAEAEPLARQLASAERRSTTIDQWLRDLRSRADITIVSQ